MYRSRWYSKALRVARPSHAIQTRVCQLKLERSPGIKVLLSDGRGTVLARREEPVEPGALVVPVTVIAISGTF